MRRNSAIIGKLKESQQRVFRLAERDHNLSKTAIYQELGGDSGPVDYDSICNYASGKTEMPVGVLIALIDIIPDDLLSLLLPGDRMIIRKPEGLNHDEAAEAMHDFLATKHAAHHPLSEAGRDIGPTEDDTLRTKFAVVAGGRG